MLPAQKSPNDGTKKELLIIDDNLEVIQALTLILSKEYRLVICNSYEDSKSKMRDDIKVVLLDIKMALINGIEVFALLKKQYPNTNIIFHSAYPGSDASGVYAQELPHSGYLIKGEYSINELLLTIDNAFSSTL